MEIDETIFSKISVGEVFKNPKKGTSIIVSIDAINIRYKRCNSSISLPKDVFRSVWKEFKSKKCSSNDLKKYCPKIFNSKKSGHSCNCTFLFLIAQKMELLQQHEISDEGVREILGGGKRGSPFYVFFR